MQFTYEAVKADGSTIKGQLDAESKIEALQRLQQQNLWITKIRNTRSLQSIFSFLNVELQFRKRLNLKEEHDVLQRMHILLSSGLQLEEVLFLLVEQGGNSIVRHTLAAALENVREGASLSSAFEKTNAFSEAFVGAIRAGEASGSLEEVIGMLSTQTGRLLKLSGQMKSAMAYPGFLMLFCIAVLIFR